MQYDHSRAGISAVIECLGEVKSMSDEKKIEKVLTVDSGKALGWKPGEGKYTRDGEKPSAPANLVMPKPVVIPAPPASASKEKK
jgi:hypothetical protein